MKALIMGGGIAGAVTAMALEKAGFEAHLFEAHERTADGVGAFLTLAVNGIAALRAIDVDAASLPGAIPTPVMAIHLGSGEQVAELTPPARSDGVVTSTIKRSDLYVALRDEAVRRGVAVAYGKRIVDATSVGGTVVAHFADGTSAEGDVLIGADGLKSRVRTIIDPKAPPARYVGLLNTGGYAQGLSLDARPGTFHMVFGKRCFFGYAQAPSGEVWWFANPARRDEPNDRDLAAIDAETWRAELIDLFADDATPAVEIIRATPHIFAGWATYDLPNVPRWHRDRMIIIGDAAHAASPSSGQGASMAIEDGVVLARALRDSRSVDAAFASYESQRRERVERVVALGRRNGTGKTPGAFGRVVRDFFLRRVMRSVERQGDAPMRWLLDHRVEWS
jgi:2-polyprenyl-6-methoxyphenol hydroxylase-like FAD-dependent oxidoreductase